MIPLANIEGEATMERLISARAEWDADACVWVATSDDIGLVTESATFESLTEKVPAMIADLLESESEHGEFRVEIVARASSPVPPRAS